MTMATQKMTCLTVEYTPTDSTDKTALTSSAEQYLTTNYDIERHFIIPSRND